MITQLGSVFCGFHAFTLLPVTPTEMTFTGAALLRIFGWRFDTWTPLALHDEDADAFGLRLDSLADVIPFGVAPSFLVYTWVLTAEPIPGILTAFFFVASAAVRLARFT